jgi:hypothetical protein
MVELFHGLLLASTLLASLGTIGKLFFMNRNDAYRTKPVAFLADFKLMESIQKCP